MPVQLSPISPLILFPLCITVFSTIAKNCNYCLSHVHLLSLHLLSVEIGTVCAGSPAVEPSRAWSHFRASCQVRAECFGHEGAEVVPALASFCDPTVPPGAASPRRSRAPAAVGLTLPQAGM